MIFAGLVPHSSVAAQCGLGVPARTHFHHLRRHWGAQDHLRQRVRKASLVQLKFVAPARADMVGSTVAAMHDDIVSQQLTSWPIDRLRQTQTVTPA